MVQAVRAKPLKGGWSLTLRGEQKIKPNRKITMGSSLNHMNTFRAGGGPQMFTCDHIMGEVGHRYVNGIIKNRAISVPRAVIEPRQIDRKIFSLTRFNFY